MSSGESVADQESASSLELSFLHSLSSLSSDSEESEIYLSKDKKYCWKSHPTQACAGRLPVQNVMRSRPGPTKFATSRITDETTAFSCLFQDCLLKEIVKYSNKYGKEQDPNWEEIIPSELCTFIALIILAGVYKA